MNIIKKTNPNSFFLRFHENSKVGDQLLSSPNSMLKDNNGNKMKVIILQIMNIGDGQLITELVDEVFYSNQQNNEIQNG